MYRQEKYDQAHSHFRLAAAVNPRSSVLACYVGMSAHRLGQSALALDKLQVGGRARECMHACSGACMHACNA